MTPLRSPPPCFTPAQYAEALRAKVAALEAQLVAMDAQLSDDRRVPPNPYQLVATLKSIRQSLDWIRPAGVPMLQLLRELIAFEEQSRPPAVPPVGVNWRTMSSGRIWFRLEVDGGHFAQPGDEVAPGTTDYSVRLAPFGSGRVIGRVEQINDTGESTLVLVRLGSLRDG